MLSVALAAPAGDPSDRYYQAIRNDRLAELNNLIKDSGTDVRDKRGTTPLMFAAAFGSLDAMKALVDAGADVNAKNAFDATALLWCATDLAKVRLLVSKGADVNARSKQGRTPLLIAAGTFGSSEVVKLLIDKRADLKRADADPVTTPLAFAVSARDAAVVSLLLERGAEFRGPAGGFGLMIASSNGDTAIMQALLSRGVPANVVGPPTIGPPVKNGNIALGSFTPLILASAYGGYDAVKMLLDAKADVNAKDVRGMTPLMLALSSDRPDPKVVRLLLERGADPAIQSKDGETAVDWAKKFRNPDVLDPLKISAAPVKVTLAEKPVEIHQAVETSTALLQRTSGTAFIEGGCPSCHSHNLPAAAVAAARKAGIRVNEEAAAESARQTRAFWVGQEQTLLQRIDLPAGTDITNFATLQLEAEAVPPSLTTDVMVHNTASQQLGDGSWHVGGTARAPMEDGDMTRTALSLHTLRLYGPAGRKAELDERVSRAARWIETQRPVNNEDANFQILGLLWAGRNARSIAPMVEASKRMQREDGGWSQTPYLASDAYATGQTLYALAMAGVPVTDPAYRKGAGFLLRTQKPDGSWHVPSRAPKFQPYFQSGFPYDHDQWISMAATAWADIALSTTAQRW